MPEQKNELQSLFSCIFAPNASKQEVIDIFKKEKIDGWLCSPAPKYKIDNDILKHAKNLEIISTPSTGTNHIIKEDCTENKIEVFSLKDTDFVKTIYASSEFAFSLILAVARNLPQATQSVLAYQWREVEDNYRGIELRNKKLGVIGFGRIGSNVANYAQAMGMKVFAYDPHSKIDEPYTSCKNIDAVLEVADILLISVHLDEDTENMVDSEWFRKMKQGSYFVNISRGEIVNEEDLIQALEDGQIKAAGLDVIRNELSNKIMESPIINYAKNNKNLIITPHMAGLTFDSERKAADYSTNILKSFLRQ